MKKCKVKLGRLVLMYIEGESKKPIEQFNYARDRYSGIADYDTDLFGGLTYLFFEPHLADELVENLKNDPVFQENVLLEVYGKGIGDVLYKFEGTLIDAFLIAAKEGTKYDV